MEFNKRRKTLGTSLLALCLAVFIPVALGASGTNDDQSDWKLLDKAPKLAAAGEHGGGHGDAAHTGGHGNAAHGGGHGDAAHGEEGQHHGPEPLLELPEFLPNFVSFFTFNPGLHGNTFIQWLHVYAWENILFSLLNAGLLIGGIFLLMSASRPETTVPSRPQMLLEIIFEAMDKLTCGVIGPQGRKYTPFIGSLFIYIWCMNMQGLVPGLKSPTSYIGVTLGLGAVVFIYVHVNAIRETGFGGWLWHLAGAPEDVIGWAMSPLMFVLHVVGELIKPLSLSLRLFGNVMGEDSLIGVFALLGIVLLSVLTGGPTTLDGMMGLAAQHNVAELASWQWFGIPLQLPFMILALLTGTIQALVFALLATIYIFLFLPHEDHGHEGHEHGEGEGHGQGTPAH